MNYRFLDCSDGSVAFPIQQFIGRKIITACADQENRQIVMVFDGLQALGVQFIPAMGLHALAITTGHLDDQNAMRAMDRLGRKQNLAVLFVGQVLTGVSQSGVFEFQSGLQVRFDESGLLCKTPPTGCSADRAPAD